MPIQSYYEWNCQRVSPTASDEERFPAAFYGSMPGRPDDRQETWNWSGFSAQPAEALNEPIYRKVKVFYGASKLAEANFTFRKQERS
jgi:hypothetical protein